MLMNNLDPDVAERPEALVVYGGIGRAARNWEAFDRIVASLRALADDETLLIQSGKPVGVFRTTPTRRACCSPTATWCRTGRPGNISTSSIAPGLMMYGQMTAGSSWIYIGSQGIVQGTYETFVEAGPPALRRVSFGRKVDPHRRTRRHGRRAAARRQSSPGASIAHHRMPAEIASTCACAPRYVDRQQANDLDDALARIDKYVRGPVPGADRSALLGNAADILPELVRRGMRPDAVTDQTSRARSGQRLPARSAGASPTGWERARKRDPAKRGRATPPSARCASHVEAMLAFANGRAFRRSITATTFARWPGTKGCANAFDFPGFVPAYVRPLFCRGVGPFRWVGAVRCNPEDIFQDRRRR